ncbi:helix-hairpin-helix domain-containing protein [Fructilactobacillus florum]|uniref:Competence protein n=1 Tax=Fructilactobacillus florum DSM 22689 = JCM 16035 TaxID=1423745 RepID=A0A0R2CJ59_9LACO|nr:helix-hairpin-helix domain-containing protein [Fructilactobacillus florum]KRM91679.1 Competence protein [Fructilactobacillus florum DSM 22689 = JCM 16035]
MDKYREKLVELVQDHGAKLWIVIIGIMVVISGYFLWPQSVASSENQQQVTQPVSPKSQPIHQKGMLKKTFVVEVKGAVQRPGVYHLPPGTRCETLIQQAGGFTPTADQRQVNLAKKLLDQESLYVPAQGENKSITMPTGGGSEQPSEPINLNEADVTKLQQIDGVGAKKAEKIVAYRQAHGEFKSVDDLKNVAGFGVKTVAKLKDNLTI